MSYDHDFAECLTGVTITPDQGPFEEDDVLTCSSADGYDPTYTWTGTVNGVSIAAHIGSTYTLPVGDFELTCTATVEEVMCTDDISDSVDGTVPADGK